MRKRPLCFLCLVFLGIKCFLMIETGGHEQNALPANSVFQDNIEREVLVQGQVYQKKQTEKNQILYLKNNSIKSIEKNLKNNSIKSIEKNLKNNSIKSIENQQNLLSSKYSNAKQNSSMKHKNFQTYFAKERKLIVYDKTFQEVKIGQTVVVKGKTALFETAHNTGNFDQRLYYRQQGIHGFVWGEQIVRVTGTADVWREQLEQWKQQWKQLLVAELGEKNGAVMSAILLSEKGEMDEEIKELYQKSGIGHILAISGLHISFLGLGIYQILRKNGCSFWAAGIGAGFLLGIYVQMIGVSVSVIRACMMLVLRIGADITGRVYDMATALSISAVITVLWRPLCLIDAGFLLSYGAICGILLVLPSIKQLFPCKRKVWENAYASISIQLMLFPILLYFYFEIPTYSIFLNMLVLPLMSVLLGLGIVGSIGMFLCRPMGHLCLKICSWILGIFEKGGRISSNLPYARIVFGRPFAWQIGVYYLLLCVAVVGILQYTKKETAQKKQGKDVEQRKRRKKIRRRIQMGSIVVASCMTGIFWIGHGRNFTYKKQPNLAITMLDVGQGDGIFLRGAKGKTYLIDGGSSDVKQVGAFRIEPFLKSQGVGKLDYVFVSHGDSDHYSGIEELLKRQELGVRIEHLVFPITYQEDENLYQLALLAKKKGVQTLVIKGGEGIKEGQMDIRCIQPCASENNPNLFRQSKQSEQSEHLKGNAASMILEISYGKFHMLCTGDVEQEGEKMLIEKLRHRSAKERDYDVLKVAHHGSKNSTSEEFLDCVKTNLALISAGRDNRYGHPHQETIEQLEKRNVIIYNTQECGEITLRTDGKNVYAKRFH